MLLSIAPFVGYFVSFSSVLCINLFLYLVRKRCIHPIFFVGFVSLFQDPYFSIYKIPLWYVVIVIYSVYSYNKHFEYHRKNVNTHVAVFLFIFTVLHAILSAKNFDALEFAMRFSVTIYVLPTMLWYEIKIMNIDTKLFLSRSLNVLFLGCCICGFLQTLSFFTGIGEPLIDYSLRPTAFTSESTWFGLIGVIGLINLNWEKNSIGKISSVIFIAAIVVSESRNAYIGLALYVLFFNWRLGLYALFVSLCMSLYLFELLNMSNIFDKFLLNDLSSIGRTDAYYESFELIKSNIFGTGWEYSYSYAAKPTIGAMSFNLMFHFFHVFGWIGIIPIIGILCIYFTNGHYILSINKIKLVGILFILCMVAPLHFSPFYILFLIVIGLNDGSSKDYPSNQQA